VALAECAMTSGLGVEVVLQSGVRPSAALFGETTARALVSFGSEEERAIRDSAAKHGVPFHIVGRVGGDGLRISVEDRLLLDESVPSLNEIWANAFARAMEAADVL
jgi:phosphoribosylformylglycinamidine synthase